MPEEYDLADFGGVLPGAGDLVVDPAVDDGLDRREPGNRQVYTVVHRLPLAKSQVQGRSLYMVLVRRERAGQPSEADIVTSEVFGQADALQGRRKNELGRERSSAGLSLSG